MSIPLIFMIVFHDSYPSDLLLQVGSSAICPDLDAPTYGGLYYTGNRKPNGTATIFCPIAFKIVPPEDKTLVCRSDLTWSAPVPRCVLDRTKSECEPPSLPGNSSIVSPQGPYHVFDAVQLSCPWQFRETGNKTIQCDHQKKWVINFTCILSYSCKPFDVGDRDIIVKGNTDRGYLANHTLTLACPECYQVSTGSNTVTCDRNGTWTSPEPFGCNRATCTPYLPSSQMTVVEDGISKYNAITNNATNTTATLRCNTGFAPASSNASATVTCMGCNTWNSPEFTCCPSCPPVGSSPSGPQITGCLGSTVSFAPVEHERQDGSGTDTSIEQPLLTCMSCGGNLEWHVDSCDEWEARPFYVASPELLYLPVIGLLGAILVVVSVCFIYRHHTHYTSHRRKVTPTPPPGEEGGTGEGWCVEEGRLPRKKISPSHLSPSTSSTPRRYHQRFLDLNHSFGTEETIITNGDDLLPEDVMDVTGPDRGVSGANTVVRGGPTLVSSTKRLITRQYSNESF